MIYDLIANGSLFVAMILFGAFIVLFISETF